MERIELKDLEGFLVGNAQDTDAMTGCTAIIAPEGAVCGVDVRGGSPGTRDTDALDPRCNRQQVHGIILSGGSAFGLDCAGGLMALLEEKRIGRDVGVTVVPNVCAAILFDLKCGRGDVRPDAKMGRQAGENAFAKENFKSGNYGAGTGATVGKVMGSKYAMKGGVGAAALRQGDLFAAAVFAVNCAGDVAENGSIIAGVRGEDGVSFADSEEIFLRAYSENKDLFASNTVIGCIMTNALLTKPQAARISAQGQNAIARCVRPAHTIHDGDTVFTLSTSKVPADINSVGILAARAAEAAIIDAVKSAGTYGDYLSYADRMKKLG
ncbi:MAG: P1 family peptidase [Eubacteriaceae bacterium]|nr:P1 family peptidase [Eubacteriaceae bacterium]